MTLGCLSHDNWLAVTWHMAVCHIDTWLLVTWHLDDCHVPLDYLWVSHDTWLTHVALGCLSHNTWLAVTWYLAVTWHLDACHMIRVCLSHDTWLSECHMTPGCHMILGCPSHDTWLPVTWHLAAYPHGAAMFLASTQWHVIDMQTEMYSPISTNLHFVWVTHQHCQTIRHNPLTFHYNCSSSCPSSHTFVKYSLIIYD